MPYRFEIDPAGASQPVVGDDCIYRFGVVACGIFIALNGMNPIMVYAKMLKGAFGSSFGLRRRL